TSNQLISMINQASQNLNRLSPALTLQPTPSEQVDASLIELRDEKKLQTPEAMLILKSMAETNAIGHATYIGRFIFVDMAVYHPQSDTLPIISLSSQQEKIRLQSPPPVEETILLLSEQVGSIMLDSTNVEMKLSRLEGLLLMAVIDAARRTEMQRFLHGDDQSTEELKSAHVSESFDTARGGAQWLTPYLQDCLVLESPMGPEFHSGLASLAEKGLLSLGRDSIQLTFEVQKLVSNFLLVEGHLRLRSTMLSEVNDNPSYFEVRVIQGRTGAFLVWMPIGDEIRLLSASGAGVLNLVEQFLLSPQGVFGKKLAVKKNVVQIPPPEKLS
ncbi:MAG: hypothetical protein ABIG63_15265, partial [Chloroflexota bacterium]